ncbi:MAG: DNA polymerase III subunit [Planctomycetota bacterium]
MIRLLAQPAATDQLNRQLAAGRLPHALVFAGPAGVGKHTAALWLAQRLLCLDPVTTLTGEIEPCDACESCRLLLKLANDDPSDGDDDTDDAISGVAHPDLHLIHKQLAATSSVATLRTRKQTNIAVDLLREHVVGGTTSDGNSHDAPAFKSPVLSRHKVFVIDEAELLDGYAQNVLLKTLEEPPPNTTLILVTAREDRLLPTIRSRCQRVPFSPLPDNVVTRWLSERLGDDHANIPWLTQFAAGSLGRAKIAIDHGLAAWGAALEPQLDALAQGKPAPTLGGDLYERVQAFAEAAVKKQKNASKEAANRVAASLAWSIVARHAHRRLTAEAEAATPRDLPAAARLERWAAVLDAVHEAEGLLASNVNLSLLCDDLAARCATLLNPLPKLTPAA